MTKLDTLASRINKAHRAAKAQIRSTIEHVIAAARLLEEAKAQIGHGGWVRWLAANTNISLRTAQTYMQVARKFPELDAPKAQRVALLPLREMVRELSNGDRRVICPL